MSGSGGKGAEDKPSKPVNREPPLVIVSEQGRHSEASRRLVRAQAARASAAQSRVTRARNREEREGNTVRDDNPSQAPPPLPRTPSQATTSSEPQSSKTATSQTSPDQPNVPLSRSTGDLTHRPLVQWLTSLLSISLTSVLEGTATLTTDPINTSVSTVTNTLGFASTAVSTLSSSLPFSPLRSFIKPLANALDTTTTTTLNYQLPLALPRGFANLQSRIQISDGMVTLLSRTACVDFGSPGVEQRLHQLLFDLILTSAGAALSSVPLTGHPIQGHLRVACTCLTIFQGQRANGRHFAHDRRYQGGLEAAWSEAMLLDPHALADDNSPEASLWAIFIICVTTGIALNTVRAVFQQQILGLLRDLQLQYWSQVRKVLLDFIYPVSFLDEPCKNFYQSLSGGVGIVSF